MSEIKLVVGLGNPGAKYDETRHNVGFVVLDQLAKNLGVPFRKESKWEGELARWGDLYLLKPHTFMNHSGRAVGSLCRFFRWKPEEVLAIYDEVSLPLGTLRFRAKGGHAGHNGVRSLIDHLGGENFPRLKIGIESVSGEDLVAHVLNRFRPDERELVENTLVSAAEAVQLALTSGVEKAANQFNSRITKPKENHQHETEIRRTDHSEHNRDGVERG